MDLGFSPFLHDHHTQTSSYLLIYFILLVTTIIVQQKLTNYTNYVPEACVSTGLGLLISLLFYLCGGYRPNYNNYNESQFNVNSIRLSETLFYFGLLPPILFNSGFHLRRKLFVRNIKPIFLLAIVGTLISTFVIAFVLKYLYDNHSTSLFGGAHVEIELMEFIVFASLLSSTDPVAVLAAFSKIRVEPNLFLIVMGESSLNDAVALTLFKVTSSYVGNQMKTNDGISTIFTHSIQLH
jgi:NhaP-type Na+/H+ or K+/H+ antiporter